MERRHARTVPADHRERNRRRLVGGGDGAGKIGEDQTFGAVGDAGKSQRLAGAKPSGRRRGQQGGGGRHCGFVPSPLRV